MANLRNDARKRLGIWIDHKEAVFVFLDNGDARVERIESNADSNVRAKGGYKAAGTSMAQSVMKEQSSEERRKHQLRDFYQAVIKSAAKAESIYIFGPGGAKNELETEIKKTGRIKDRIAALETSDSMTENQIVAKVKAFYSVPDERYPQ